MDKNKLDKIKFFVTYDEKDIMRKSDVDKFEKKLKEKIYHFFRINHGMKEEQEPSVILAHPISIKNLIAYPALHSYARIEGGHVRYYWNGIKLEGKNEIEIDDCIII